MLVAGLRPRHPLPLLLPANFEETPLFFSVITENGVKLRLNIVDTPGYGDQINNEGWCVSAPCFIGALPCSHT